MATDVDWETGFDHYHPSYGQDPFTVWSALRDTCPVARSDKFRGMWVPTRYDDIEAIARDTTRFSSRSPLVAEFASMSDFGIEVPPISSDPPYHTAFRQLLLPYFSPRRIEALAPEIAAHCDELIDAFDESGNFDAAQQYAQHIPVSVIAKMLGVPDEDAGMFRGWVHEMLELAATDMEVAVRSLTEFYGYFQSQIEQRRSQPGDDLVSFLIGAELDGRPLTEAEVFGGCLLLLIAGIDTTWSAIGSTVWHLAQNPDQQARLRTEPEVWTTALEEFLRAFAGDDGAGADRRRRVRRMPDAPRGPVVVALPRRQPGSGSLRGSRFCAARPRTEPSLRVRGRHPPVPRLQPGPTRAEDRGATPARSCARVPPGGSVSGDVVRRPGTRAADAATRQFERSLRRSRSRMMIDRLAVDTMPC